MSFKTFYHRPTRQGTMIVLLLATIMQCTVVNAHAPEENYVWLNVDETQLSGRFEVNLKDIKTKLGIDVDAIADTRLRGVENSAQAVQEYFLNNFSIQNNGKKINLLFTEPSIFEDSNYLQYNFVSDTLPTGELSITNSLFLTPEYIKKDRLHRSLLVVAYNKVAGKEFGEENTALVFGPRNMTRTIDLANPPDILQWKDFLRQGVIHIWMGLDHILFIIVLLLTTVLVYSAGGWTAQPSFRQALWKTLKIVTLFTIAHSITLTLAALQLVNVNTIVVESIIAFSIIGIGINNIFPRFSAHSWILIFSFGLFHGLGFASVMGELQFRNVLIERIVVMFNVGVEVGQVAIVCLIFPILYLLRKNDNYRRFVVIPVSLLASAVAFFWLLQRTGVIS